MSSQNLSLSLGDLITSEKSSFSFQPLIKKLGKINMDFVRKAEKRNKQRATMHRFFRRKDWMIAGTCFGIVVGIYSYTIFAIQQEKFLDDFEMPEEIDRTQKE